MRDTLLATAAMLILAACAPQAGPDAGAAGIPTAMQARWGLTAADCAGGAAAKGLMTVSATTLTFYESRATLGAVAERDADHIRARFNFLGEGQSWSREIELKLDAGGRALTRRTLGEAGPTGVLRYRRCD